MNKKSYTVAALAIVGLVLTAGLVIAVDNNGTLDTAAVDDFEEEEMTGAGGGGWFKYNGAKDTFGFHLNNTNWSMSEFVLQARDVGIAIHAYQFDSIAFAYDSLTGTGSADASGRAWVDGVDAAFHLVVEDNGNRTLDRLMLEVTTDVTQTWDITGLGGGQIWVFLE